MLFFSASLNQSAWCLLPLAHTLPPTAPEEYPSLLQGAAGHPGQDGARPEPCPHPPGRERRGAGKFAGPLAGSGGTAVHPVQAARAPTLPLACATPAVEVPGMGSPHWKRLCLLLLAGLTSSLLLYSHYYATVESPTSQRIIAR